MPHEPIDPSSDWQESRQLIAYEINRCSRNIHDLRGEMQGQLLRMEEKRMEDNVRHETSAHANSIRVAVLEAKIFLYALIGGAIGTAAINLILLKLK